MRARSMPRVLPLSLVLCRLSLAAPWGAGGVGGGVGWEEWAQTQVSQRGMQQGGLGSRLPGLSNRRTEKSLPVFPSSLLSSQPGLHWGVRLNIFAKISLCESWCRSLMSFDL